MCSNWSSSIFKKGFSIGFLILSLTLPACDGFLEIGVPKSQLVSATAFENESTARSALLAIYAEMISSEQGFASGGNNSISVLAGLSADELIDKVGNKADFQNNSLEATNDVVRGSIWASAYKYIYYANGILEGLAISTKLKDEVKKPMEGEAKFLRAFIYFYLTNLFGDIPLILETGYETNNVTGKVSSSEVYQQIMTDLNDAEQLLPVSFDQEQTYGRARAGKYAAKALLARVYLYQENWAKAEELSTEVISSGYYDLVDNINDVFLAENNPEAIWQLMSAYEGTSLTWEAAFFLAGGAFVTDEVVNLFNSDMTDMRQYLWMISLDQDFIYDSVISLKYRPFDSNKPETVQYSTVLRLAEQYLIRAEARAHLGDNLIGAVDDLNKVHLRASAFPIDVMSSQDELLQAIELERRKELFTEWGHRWFDLKRTGRASVFLAPLKGASWQSTDILYPIPASEIVQNPNLGPQNGGY